MSQTQTSASILKPAVFFDRDGVLNRDRGYVYKIEDWEWIDGAISAIKKFNALNYFVFIVTNQSGVGRGCGGNRGRGCRVHFSCWRP